MKATSESNIGNFAVTVEVDADAQFLANLGVRWLVQRQSSIDKVLGGFRKNAKGKQERIPGWKRVDVEYSAEMAERLKASLAKLEQPDSDETIAATALVSEYVREAAEKKFAQAKGFAAQAESSKEGLEAWLLRKCNYSGETHDSEGEYAKEMLVAIDNAFKAFVMA